MRNCAPGLFLLVLVVVSFVGVFRHRPAVEIVLVGFPHVELDGNKVGFGPDAGGVGGLREADDGGDEGLPKMLDASASDGLTIFWIPVRPSAYRQSPIARFQAAQPPDKPLSRLRGAARDDAFVKIGEKLARVLGVGAE